MNNKWYLQLGDANEYKFIAQPELLFCAYELLRTATSNDVLVNDEEHKITNECGHLTAEGDAHRKMKQLEQDDDLHSEKTRIWLRCDQHYTHRYYYEAHHINIVSESYLAATTADRKRIWKTRGLRVTEQLTDERLFLVRIFDFCLLSWQRVNADLKPMQTANSVARDHTMQISYAGSIISEKTLRQMEVYASRALYALWLDAGSVLVAISGTGSIAIREVWSLDDLQYVDDQQAISMSLVALSEIASEQREHKLLIGADPEFALLNSSNQIVPASNFFNIDSDTKIGADALMSRQKVVYPVVELRPSPQRLPLQLINQMKRLLLDAALHIDDHELRWVAGAMPAAGLALGGHIHFSGMTITPRLLRILDGIVAIPLATIEDPLGRGRYKRYGALGDYRRQPHGGFEYRTPPSWLISPATAKAALTLAYIAMKDYDSLATSFSLKQAWCQAYDEGDYELLAVASRTMLDQIAKLPSYSEHANDIEPLHRAIAEQRHWDEQDDIRKRWGIP